MKEYKNSLMLIFIDMEAKGVLQLLLQLSRCIMQGGVVPGQGTQVGQQKHSLPLTSYFVFKQEFAGNNPLFFSIATVPRRVLLLGLNSHDLPTPCC